MSSGRVGPLRVPPFPLRASVARLPSPVRFLDLCHRRSAEAERGGFGTGARETADGDGDADR